MRTSFSIKKFFDSFLRSWQFHTVMNATTLVVLTGSFTIIIGTLVIYKNINKMIVSWNDKVQLSVYLGDEATEDEVKSIEAALKSDKGFSEIKYLSKSDAKKKFEKQMSKMDGDLFLEDDQFNPLPASFEATVASGVANKLEFLKSTTEKLVEFSGIDDLSYGHGWVSHYSALVRSVTHSGLTLILVLVFGSILVVGNSIRSSVYQRAEEVKIMELVGATQAMVRAPFVFEGALMGALASILALSIAAVVTSWQSELISQHFGLVIIGDKIEFLGIGQMGLTVISGTLFGGIGSYLCVQTINSGWASSSEI